MNLWEWMAWFFWIFVFVAYLMVVFSIIADIFRDSTLSGWLKAVWIIFLVFVPFLTALIYLIARGGGMQRRSLELATQNQKQQQAYIRATAATASASTEIADAKSLMDAGTISPQEFDLLKAKALAR